MAVVPILTLKNGQTVQYNEENNEPTETEEIIINSQVGDLEKVEHLLKQGKHVDTRGRKQKTPLWVAAEQGHIAVMQLLIANGANIEVKATELLLTPLHAAVKAGQLESVKTLITAGANVNATNHNGVTPLHYAARHGNLQIIQDLYDKGADILMKDFLIQNTPIVDALYSIKLDAFHLLYKYLQRTNEHISERHSCISVAAFRGLTMFLQALVEDNETIQEATHKGKNLLMSACYGGHFDTAKYVYSLGIDVNERNSITGYTALLDAATSGNMDIVKWLVEEKADIHIVGKDAISPLHVAAQNGHIPVVEYLLKIGIDIDIVDKNGKTPLAFATCDAQLATIQWLVKEGARTDVRPYDVPLPDLAASYDRTDKSKKEVVSNYLKSPELEFIHGKDDTKVKWGESEKIALLETCNLKVATVGELKSGKTSLARSLISNNQYRTHVDERTVVMEHRNWRVGDKQTISVVDLGGHKSYHNTGFFFIANHPSNVVLLCHEITSRRYHVTYFWLRGVITRAPRCHVIPVITKRDLVESDEAVKNKVQDFIKEMERFLNRDLEDMEIKHYMHSTSCENKQRIQVLMTRYQELKQDFSTLLCITSTAPLQGETINLLKDKIQTRSQNPELFVEIPLSNLMFYSVIGGLGSKIQIQQAVEKVAMQITSIHNEHEASGSVTEPITKTKPCQDIRQTDGHISVEQPSERQYITYDEAKQTFESIEKSLGKNKTSDKDTKAVLKRLHHTGLALWFQGSPVLEHIIFNNLDAFISVLKTVFHHDVHEFLQFDSLSTKQKALFQNRRSKFQQQQDLLLQEGLVSVAVLQSLLLQNQCDLGHVFISSLLEKLNLGYKYENNDENMLFIPYFIESKLMPHDVYYHLPLIRRSTPTEISLTSSIRGNIPQTFFNYVLLKMFEHLQKKHPLEKRQVWGKGMKAPQGSGSLLLIYYGNKCIDLIIKAPPIELPTIWECITYFCQISKDLRNVWWPGLSTGIVLKCAACAKSYLDEQKNQKSKVSKLAQIPSWQKFDDDNQCELDLEDLVEADSNVAFYNCLSGKEIPIGAVQPLKTDSKALSDRILHVETFLKDNCIEERIPETRLSCRTSITAQEMMTASYYCLMDDMEFSFASHLHHTGVISKAVEEEVDQLYRLQGPQVAVRKLTEVLKKQFKTLNLESILASILEKEETHVANWFKTLYNELTGELSETADNVIGSPLAITHSSLNAFLHNKDTGRGLFSREVDQKLTRQDIVKIFDVMEYICILDYLSNTGGFTATGFLLGFVQHQQTGKTYAAILTNKHVLDVWKSGFAFFNYYSDSEGKQNGIALTKEYAMWNEDLDYAMFCADDPGLIQAFISKQRLIDTVTPIYPEDKSITLIGHPNGRPLQVDFCMEIQFLNTIRQDPKVQHAASLALQGIRIGSNLNFFEHPHRTFYRCTSFHGSSGSPCFRVGSGHFDLVCLQSGGIFLEENEPGPHDISDYESGVLMSFIRDDINSKIGVIEMVWV